MKLKEILARILKKIFCKNQIEKDLSGENSHEINVTCNESVMQKISAIMGKYGWDYNDFTNLIKSSVETPIKLEKVVPFDSTIETIEFSEGGAQNHIIFSNIDESIRIQFLELNFLEIIITEGNEIKIYDINKKVNDNQEIKGKLRSHVDKRVINGKTIAFKNENNFLEETVNFGRNKKFKVKIYDKFSYDPISIKCFAKKREMLEEILANTDEESLRMEILNEIQKITDGLHISGEEKRNLLTEVETIQNFDDGKIIYKSTRNKYWSNNLIIIKEGKEEIIVSIDPPLSWKYTNGDTVIEHSNDSKDYVITISGEESKDIKKLIDRAKKLAEIINDAKLMK